MLFVSGRPRRASLAIVIAAYAITVAFTAAVTAHVAWRAGTGIVAYFAPAAETQPARDVAIWARATRAATSVPAAAAQSVRSEAIMTPLADRWDGGGAYGRPQPRVWGSAGSPFGSSSRNPNRRYDDDNGPFGSDDDERPIGTFRTVCVRLCDGYYFPVSFAIGADRLARDRNLCESRCGAQGRLFVHPNPGGSIDDLRDLNGRPYSQLRTAFLYRTEYVPSCACQPQPWDQASQDRHRLYALAESARKGSKEAGKELVVLQAKLKETAKLAARSGDASAASPGDATRPGMDPAASARAAEIARREDGNYMGLANDGAPKVKSDRPPLKSRQDGDWTRRVFESHER
jgi:hypothetical protein